MKNKNIILASLLVFAMLASMMPLYDASAPAIETEALDTSILISNVAANPSTVDQGGAVNITCNVTANGTIAIKYVNLTVIDPNSASTVYSMNPGALTNITLGSGTYWYNQTYDIAGTYTYWINVTDENGNYNITGNYTFTVNDITKPTISNVASTPSSVVQGNSVNVTANISDNVGVTAVKIIIVDPGNTTSTYDMTNNNGTYYYEATYTVVGTYNFTINASDAAGNYNTATGNFTVAEDTAAPTISNVQATPASIAQGGSVNITADVNDAGIGVDTVMVNITYPDGTSQNMSMSAYNGTYYFNTTYDAIGTYSFFVWANDSNNNAISSDMGTFEVTDGTAPVIDAVNSSVNVNMVTITATITDNVGVSSATVTIFNSTGAPLTGYPADMNETNATTHTYEYTSGALLLGNYTFVIEAADAAGNNAQSTGSFEITDNQPPAISNITVPANIVEGNDVTISCTVTDNIGVAAVTITLDGQTHNMTMTDGQYTYTATSVAFGDHSFTISATDAAGNSVTSQEQTFTAGDADTPTANPSLENPTKATLGSTITIQYSVSDPDGIASVTLHYTIDGVEQTPIQMTLVNGTYSADIALPKEGNNLTYWVEATDNSGTTTTTQPMTITLEKKEAAPAALDPMLLAGIGILILIIIIAAAVMMKKKGAAPSEESEEEESEEEAGEEEEESEEEELDEEEEL